MSRRVILASGSPRRRELLAQIGISFEVMVSDADETLTSTQPSQVVEELSARKAGAVAQELIVQMRDAVQGAEGGSNGNPAGESADARKPQMHDSVCGAERGSTENPAEESASVQTAQTLDADCDEILIIGADTVVSCDGEILGKPHTPEQAVEMLRKLRGRTHEVYTGVTLLCMAGEAVVESRTFHEATKVHFYPMSAKEIEAYVATGDPMDKAGAYGIQGICARYIRGIDGDYNNVVGLPVGRLYQELCEMQWL